MQNQIITLTALSLCLSLLFAACTITSGPAPPATLPHPIVAPPSNPVPNPPGALDRLAQDWLDAERTALATWLLTEAGNRGFKLEVDTEAITNEVAATLEIRLHNFSEKPEEPAISAAATLTFKAEYEKPEESLDATFSGQMPASVQAASDLTAFQIMPLYEHAFICSFLSFPEVKAGECLGGGEFATIDIDQLRKRSINQMGPHPSPTPSNFAAPLEPPSSDRIVVLRVASVSAECSGLVPMELPIVNGECFYGIIEGFDREPGFKYRLKVRMTRKPPEEMQTESSEYRWLLLEVLEKTRADGHPVD